MKIGYRDHIIDAQSYSEIRIIKQELILKTRWLLQFVSHEQVEIELVYPRPGDAYEALSNIWKGLKSGEHVIEIDTCFSPSESDPISCIDCSVRTYNILLGNQILYIGDLLRDYNKLRGIKGLGKKSWTEIDSFIDTYNFNIPETQSSE